MSDPLSAPFECPNCGAKYEIVRAEVPPQPTADREVRCVSCGGSLRGRHEGEWYPVPPEAVVKTENPVGEAIVWYLHKGPEVDLPRDERYRIICFIPSGDV